LVVERRFAPETDTVVLETMPVGSTPALDENVRPQQRRPCLLARWVPDHRGEQSLICIWVPQNGADASPSSLDPSYRTGF
jgi:hypothetical protein